MKQLRINIILEQEQARNPMSMRAGGILHNQLLARNGRRHETFQPHVYLVYRSSSSGRSVPTALHLCDADIDTGFSASPESPLSDDIRAQVSAKCGRGS